MNKNEIPIPDVPYADVLPCLSRGSIERLVLTAINSRADNGNLSGVNLGLLRGIFTAEFCDLITDDLRQFVASQCQTRWEDADRIAPLPDQLKSAVRQ